MNEKPENRTPDSSFVRKVEASARRQIKSNNSSNKGVWFGLGMMGLVGWSVVVPTILGAALGLWLDGKHVGEHHGNFNWTVALLVAGLCIGCLNAWNWVAKEDKAMHEETEDADE